MKKKLIKDGFFLLLFLSVTLMSSCKNADVSPDDSVVGTYKIIVNPLLCSLPTMTDVKIKSTGTTYNLTFTYTMTSSKEELTNLTVEKTDNTSTIFYKGTEMGKFTSLKYTDWSNGNIEEVEGMVLMLRFENDKKHYEFMGKK